MPMKEVEAVEEGSEVDVAVEEATVVGVEATEEDIAGVEAVDEDTIRTTKWKFPNSQVTRRSIAAQLFFDIHPYACCFQW